VGQTPAGSRIRWIFVLAFLPILAKAQSPKLTPDQLRTIASTYVPSSIAIDATGNFYIAETHSSQVRKLPPSGAIEVIAGTGTPGYGGDGGPAISSLLNKPSDIAVDSAGNFFIADTGNSRIRKVATTGVITTIAGNGTSGFSGDNGPAVLAKLDGPRGIALDAAGNLFIADTNNGRIRRVDRTGTISTVAGAKGGVTTDGGPAIRAQLRWPQGIAFDAAGNLYIADVVRIRKVTVTGNIQTVAGNGMRGFSGDGGIATSAQLSSAQGVAVDEAGNIYVADTGNARIRQITPDGRITSIAGNGVRGVNGDGGPATEAQLDGPTRVKVGPSGGLYIVDSGAQRVRVVTHGQIAAVARSGLDGFPPAIESVLEALGGGSGVIPPKCAKTPEPNYSDEARRAGLEGNVDLSAVILKDGSIQTLRVLHPLGFGLDESSIAVLNEWKCAPGTLNGNPVNMQLRVRIGFHLY